MTINPQNSICALRVKAFTLIELVVAMIISSIVILTAFESYIITNMQCSDYRKKSTLIGREYQLSMVLDKDCFDAKTIYLNSDSDLVCKYDRLPEIVYLFKNNYVLRQVGARTGDTFNFALTHIQASFENKPLQPGNTLIDRFSAEAKVLNKNVYMCVRKEYAADVLMTEVKNGIKTN